MAIDLDAVGTSTDEVTVTWGPADVLLHSLAVGTGQRDPLAELDLTTENSDGVDLRPVPSFVVSLVQANSPKPYLGEIEAGDLVLDRGTVSTAPGLDLHRQQSDRERQR